MTPLDSQKLEGSDEASKSNQEVTKPLHSQKHDKASQLYKAAMMAGVSDKCEVKYQHVSWGDVAPKNTKASYACPAHFLAVSIQES